ncbi:hypothetical protein I311_00168 [Cryptococcus gattii NT-10]|nr:hypothetical protein I311_00168 [Cryptococcus gattii NT-10]
MPKPTFIQTVLRKPARSYADPHAPLPWSDNYHDAERAHSALSRQPSSLVSAASDTSFGRFPKPRKPTSHVVLRNGEIVHAPVKESLSEIGTSAASVRRTSSTRRTSPVPKPANPVKTIKKKRKIKSDHSHAPVPLRVPADSPPALHSRLSETSSASSSPFVPISPVPALPLTQPKTARPPISPFEKRPTALLTPPASKESTPNSSSQSITPIPRIIDPESDSEDDVFYTPRSSFEITSPMAIGPHADTIQLSDDTAVEMPKAMETPKAVLSATTPVFNLLPPTPAPVPDPTSTPFHSHPASPVPVPIDRSSLHPTSRPSLVPSRLIIPSRNTMEPSPSPSPSPPAPPAPPPKDEEDMESASGQAGSSCGTTTATRPSSRAQSIHSSSRRHHHHHHHVPRTSLERTTSRPTSEASFGSGAGSAGAGGGGGSRRSSVAGFGKGGWAAAAASATGGGSRSGATTPVMYLPADGTTGWEGFQPASAAAAAGAGAGGGGGGGARQSRFTPLPSASLPSFDKLVNSPSVYAGGSIGSPSNASASASPNDNNNGNDKRGKNAVSYSSPSEYSQASGSDNLPIPSRSYAKHYTRSDTASQSQSQSQSPLEASPIYPSRTPSPLSSPSPSPSPSQHSSHATSPPLPPKSPLRHSHSPIPPSSGTSTIRPITPTRGAGFEPPSFLHPDILTVLPEMTPQDSERLYRPSPPPILTERSRSRLSMYNQDNRGQASLSRSHSKRSSIFKSSKSEVGYKHGNGQGQGSEVGEEDDGLGELPLPSMIKRSKSAAGGYRLGGSVGSSKGEGSCYADGVLMESHGRDQEHASGYTNLILPLGAYKQSHPAKPTPDLDARILGLPHASMASITLHSTFDHHNATPAHLRDQLPPLVEFSSHAKPPQGGKTGKNQVLVQVYAVAVDQLDVRAVDEKGKGDVGKYVPGRSFVGRALVIGTDEKEVVRGDVVIGLLDIRKSGALAEYILVDRRRVSRAPFPTPLTLEQLSILPLQGIAAARCVRGSLNRQSRAIIINAHTGIAALVCQAMSRAGVSVTAIISGGDDSHDGHQKCIENGANGVLMGSPAAVMINLEENGYDFVFDTQGGQRVYDTARRALKNGGKLVSTKRPEATLNHVPSHMASRPSGIKTLKTVFGSKRKDSKFIVFEYVSPIGSGEPEIDASGMDYRDVMEEPCMAFFKPVLQGEHAVVPFERGAQVFKRQGWDECGVRVVRIIN